MICKSEVITTDFIHDCAGDAAWVSGRDWLGWGCALARVPGSWGRYWVLHTTQITTLSSHRHTRLRDILQGSFYVFVCLHICNIPLWPVSLQTRLLGWEARWLCRDLKGEDWVVACARADSEIVTERGTPASPGHRGHRRKTALAAWADTCRPGRAAGSGIHWRSLTLAK